MSASALPRWLLSSLLGLAGVLGGKAALAQAAADTEPVAVRIAKALSAEERYLGAAMTLLGLDPSGTPERLPEAQQWELADTLLRLAQRDAAQAIYRSLAVSSLDTERYARAQLQVAEQDLQRGRLQAATEVLDALRERLPRGQLLAWQELRARLLLAQGRYGEAAEILAELDTRDQPSHYVRYNLGVALINDGRALDGRDILDRVGRMGAASRTRRCATRPTSPWAGTSCRTSRAAPPKASSSAFALRAPFPIAPCSGWAGPSWHRAGNARPAAPTSRTKIPSPISPPSAACCGRAFSSATSTSAPVSAISASAALPKISRKPCAARSPPGSN
jgi:hypothetical protein